MRSAPAALSTPAAAAAVAVALIAASTLLTPAAVSAQTAADPHLAAPAPADAPRLEPRLHQSFKACGKKWAKRATTLAPEERAWMMRSAHKIYRVALRGRTLMTLEVLSTPSFRDCDVLVTWDRKETTVRATYFRADGSTRVVLNHLASGEVLFDAGARFFAAHGRVLLSGVDRHGRSSGRWLELDPLRSLYAAALERAPRPADLVAAR